MLIASVGTRAKEDTSSKAFSQWLSNLESWLGSEFHSVRKQNDSFHMALSKFKHQSLNNRFIGQGHAVIDNEYCNLESPKEADSQKFLELFTARDEVPQGAYLSIIDKGGRVEVLSSAYDAPPLYIVKLEDTIFLTSDSRCLLFLDGFSLEPDLEKVREWLAAISTKNNDTEKFSGTCLKGVEIVPANCQFYIDKNKDIDQAISSFEKIQKPINKYPSELTKLSFEDSVKGFEKTLIEVVKTSADLNTKQLLELSGGVSSATIASALSYVQKTKNGKADSLHAASMYFSHPSLVNTNDLPLAKEAANNINVQLSALDCTPLLRVHGLSEGDAFSRIDTPNALPRPFWQELTQHLAYKTQSLCIWSGDGAYVASGSLYCFDDVIKTEGWQQATAILKDFGVPKMRARYLLMLSYLTSKVPAVGATLVYLIDLEGMGRASCFLRALTQRPKWAKQPMLSHMVRHYHLSKNAFLSPSAQAGLIPVKTPFLDQRMIDFCDGIKQSYLYDTANDKGYSLSEAYAREKQIPRKSFGETTPKTISTKQYETTYRELMVHIIKNSANSIVDNVLSGNSLLSAYNLIDVDQFNDLACNELANVAMDFYPASNRTFHFNKQLSVESWLKFLSMSEEQKQQKCHPLYKSSDVNEVLNNA